jgi:hypothetical protein
MADVPHFFENRKVSCQEVGTCEFSSFLRTGLRQSPDLKAGNHGLGKLGFFVALILNVLTPAQIGKVEAQ